MSIKLIIFEVDNTFLDTEKALKSAFRSIGKKLNVKVKPSVIKEGVSKIGVNKTFNELWKSVLETDFDEIHLPEFTKNYSKNTTINPGTVELFERLKSQGFKMLILTNNHSKVITETLELLKLSKYFEEIIGSDLVKKCKPHQDSFIDILKKYKYKPMESVLVANNHTNRKSSKKLGMRSLIIKHPETEFIKLYQRLV